MKITNSSIETLGNQSILGSTGASAANGAGESTTRFAARPAAQADSVNLSSAGQLVSLAKASAAPANAAKLASVAALVRSGQYQTDTNSVSHAVVQGHLQ